MSVLEAARRPLEAGAIIHTHPFDMQGHTEAVAQRPAVLGPGIGRRLQAVVHMHGGQRRQGFALAQGRQQVQQHGRIQAAGQGDAPGRCRAPGAKKFEQGEFERSHAASLNNNGPEGPLQMMHRACQATP